MTSDEKYGHQDKSFDQLQHCLDRVGILDSFSCTMRVFNRKGAHQSTYGANKKQSFGGQLRKRVALYLCLASQQVEAIKLQAVDGCKDQAPSVLLTQTNDGKGL